MIAVYEAVSIAIHIVDSIKVKGVSARTVVIGGQSIIVAGLFFGTSKHFVFVTHAILVGVSEAVSIAIESGFGISARSIVHVGCVIVVTSSLVGASQHGVVAKEGQVSGRTEGGEFLTFCLHFNGEIQAIEFTFSFVEQFKRHGIARGDIQGHADPGPALVIKGFIYAHGFSIHQSEHGHAHDGLTIQADFGDVRGGNHWKNSGSQIGVCTRVEFITNPVFVAVVQTVSVAIVAVNRAVSIAHSAFVERANTVVYIITDAI